MRATIDEPPVFFHLKWVVKAALMVGATAAAGLLLAILWVIDDKGTSYGDIITRHSLTQQNLAPTMLLFGLSLVLVAALTTWLLALYSSFRIAGPLFRFSKNLMQIMDNAFAIPQAIRQSDLLQIEWAQFDASQSTLRQHYGAMHQALAACEQALAKVERPAESGSEPQSVGLAWPARRDCPELGSDPDSALQQTLVQLAEVERRVRL